MKLILIETRQIQTAMCELPIRYELLSGAQSGIEQYSIRIQNEMTGEISMVRDLTSDRKQAMRFFDSILRGSVTPVSLRDIAEDFAAEL